jgi:hypothetical protein
MDFKQQNHKETVIDMVVIIKCLMKHLVAKVDFTVKSIIVNRDLEWDYHRVRVPSFNKD